VTALEADRPAEALELLDENLRVAPDHVESVVLRSEALVLLDRWEEAEELLQEGARRHPKNTSLLLALADLIVDFHPDDSAALREAVTIAARAEELTPREESAGDMLGELRLVRGRALAALGEPAEATRAFESALEAMPGEPDVQIELAMSLFEALRFDAARQLLTQLAVVAPEDPRVHHYLGLLDERRGLSREAEEHFRQARELDPEEFGEPISLSESDFNAAVETALDGVPERVREYIANVPVLVEDVPATSDLEGEPPLSPLSLGMFRGLPGLARSHFDPWSQLPSSIVLFQKNLERYARSHEELIEEIETTVLHEVGHYLGWDDEDLSERGLD
jgi:predicted Zn-dependent protease with MMP-like domain